MIRSMRLIGSPVLIFGLASCKLECFGDGPATFNSIKLVLQSLQVLAGGEPVSIKLEAQTQYAGFEPEFNWSLEPNVGSISIAQQMVKYLPPSTVGASVDVKIVLEYHGNTDVKKASAIIKILKPQ